MRHRAYCRLALLAACVAAGTLPGCASYRVGAGTLYAPDVQTVYVPMIESDSFRRDLGERLTESVVKEIELKTPFKVVSTPTADSVLSVRLLDDTRRVLAEDPFDQPRVLENQLFAEVAWVNRRRAPLMPVQTIAIPGGVVPFRQDSKLIPASGQSIASSQQKAIEQLAQQIVGSLEEPW
ncbi:MAG: LPS assembly lipoprotein LptE [Planctomycetota bacterium]